MRAFGEILDEDYELWVFVKRALFEGSERVSRDILNLWEDPDVNVEVDAMLKRVLVYNEQDSGVTGVFYQKMSERFREAMRRLGIEIEL
ncbi:hypothetical protein KJ632_03105 [Patescibacteria group bacterium]|nr:hypothetical protein [Patescibacteria group bacterium]